MARNANSASNKYSQASRDQWQMDRLANEIARGLKGTGTPGAKNAQNVFGKEGSLSKQINQSLKDNAPKSQAETNQQVADKAKKGHTLRAEFESSVLSDLTWKDGVATATFFRGGALTYDYDVDKQSFVDWINGPSIGGFLNDEIIGSEL